MTHHELGSPVLRAGEMLLRQSPEATREAAGEAAVRPPRRRALCSCEPAGGEPRPGRAPGVGGAQAEAGPRPAVLPASGRRCGSAGRCCAQGSRNPGSPAGHVSLEGPRYPRDSSWPGRGGQSPALSSWVTFCFPFFSQELGQWDANHAPKGSCQPPWC